VRRQDLEHIIRAAADVTGDRERVIVGSQAILGEHPNAPRQLLLSPEADVYPLNRRDQTDEIDGVLGEGSMFHDTHSYYAHGVGEETATLPKGWEQRLVAVQNENTGGATGWCLELHDLLISKCVAGRERDWEFAEEAIRHGLADPDELRLRVGGLAVGDERLEAVRRTVDGVIARAVHRR
jgi:Nucleotidyltransferase of unknown function (DUF6036)